ncbi:nuclear distribution protein [Stagonosporopsis vannaccii]|nr:nuclear distribution protein [Stagonosporopsis vannaccii]
MDDYDEAVLFTFTLLESRLARLEYLLSGPTRAPEDAAQAVPDRIRSIEQSLQQLAGKTALLDNVKELLSRHKDVLTPAPFPSDSTNAPLSGAQKAVLVVERAPAFATTASQLKALDDQPVPGTDGFVKLAQLRPRIAAAEQRQLQQALKIAELRRRSGLLVQRDKQVHWVAAARCWAGYQERLVAGYRALQREEKRRAEREGGEGVGLG